VRVTKDAISWIFFAVNLIQELSKASFDILSHCEPLRPRCGLLARVTFVSLHGEIFACVGGTLVLGPEIVSSVGHDGDCITTTKVVVGGV